MRRLFRVTLAACLALSALMASGGLVGCLKDHPLVLPENGYDPALALRNDSLARFDTVEILLVDPDDSTRAIRIFKGTTLSVDTLGTHAAGDGQKLIYIVKGFKAGKGHCFTQEVSREGTAEVLWDTCAKTGNPPVVPKKPIPPRFAKDMIEVGPDDSIMHVFVQPFDSLVALVNYEPFSVPEAVQWSNSQSMIPMLPGGDDFFELKVKRNANWPGRYSSNVIIGSEAGRDTVVIFVTVRDDSLGLLRGRVIRAGGSIPEAGWRVRLRGQAEFQMSGADGGFDYGKRRPGKYVLESDKSGRIGRIDTVQLMPHDQGGFDIVVAPAGAFKELPLDWSRRPGKVAVASGHGLVPSSELGAAEGEVAVFPMENMSLSLQRFPKQGNGDVVPAEEYFESGEVLADSNSLYLAYPEDDRVGKVENWNGASRSFNVELSFQPSSFAKDGGSLLVAGRTKTGTLVLADLDGDDLTIRKVDTLAGHAWDGVLALSRGPRMAWGSKDLFLVDGNGPAVNGRIIRIDRETRKVTAWKELPEAGASDIAYRDGKLFVTASAPSGKTLYAFDENGLDPAGTVDVGRPAHRIVFLEIGSLKGLALVATDGNTVLAVDTDLGKVVGSLDIPGNKRVLSFDSDARSGKILATDGEKVYQAEF